MGNFFGISSIMALGLIANAVMAITPPEIDSFLIDSQKNEREVDLKSGKKDGQRFYSAQTSRKIRADLNTVESLVTNFEEKCNNQHKNRRRYLSKEFHCPFLNKNLVESKVIKTLKKPGPTGVDESWIVQRHVFNRGTYGHNDLLTIKRVPAKSTVIQHSMISEDEAKNYIDDPVATQEPFIFMQGTYSLEAINPNETMVNYQYFSLTDHFVLNKEISVGAVFDSMADGTIQALQTIEDGLALKNRTKLNLK